jgi:cystathionine beta-synthase
VKKGSSPEFSRIGGGGSLQLKDHFTADDLVVVIFHDHGSRYLGKMFNDDWMREKGFLEKTGMAARDLVAAKLSGELCSIEVNEPVEHALRVMSEHDFSQVSITRDKRLVGSLNETQLYAELLRDPQIKSHPWNRSCSPHSHSSTCRRRSSCSRR